MRTPALAYVFLIVRFSGLALIVPVIEEFFLRGFLMRFLTDNNWWQVSFTKIATAGLVAGTVVPMLMHPGEIVAALAWFSAVTWLMLRHRGLEWVEVVALAMSASVGAYTGWLVADYEDVGSLGTSAFLLFGSSVCCVLDVRFIMTKPSGEGGRGRRG